MKNRTIYIVFAILLVAAAAIFYYQQSSTIRRELRDFAVPDTAMVDKIFMADKMNQSVTLEKKDGVWMVNNKFKARKDAMYVLLKTIARLDIKSPVPKAMMNTVISQMAARSVKVEIYKKGDLEKVFYVGGATADQQGTYMMLENSTAPFIMQVPGFFGYLTTRFFVEDFLWRDNSLFRFNFKDIQSVNILYKQEPRYSYSVIKEGSKHFVVKDAAGNSVTPLDTFQVRDYVSRFTLVAFESIMNNVTKNRVDSLNKAVPYAVVEVMLNDKTTTELTIWKVPNYMKRENFQGEITEFDPDRMYARLKGENTIFTIQYFVFDPLLKEPGFFVKRQPAAI